MNLLKFLFMQLCYLIQLLFKQLSYMIEFAYTHFQRLVVAVMPSVDVVSTWVGRVCIVVMMTCTVCRLIYGKKAIDCKAGSLFVLGVEWVQCLCSPPVRI